VYTQFCKEVTCYQWFAANERRQDPLNKGLKFQNRHSKGLSGKSEDRRVAIGTAGPALLLNRYISIVRRKQEITCKVEHRKILNGMKGLAERPSKSRLTHAIGERGD
jgi:hypothetical protein